MNSSRDLTVALGRQYLDGIKAFKQFTRAAEATLADVPSVAAVTVEDETGTLTFHYLDATFRIAPAFLHVSGGRFQSAAELYSSSKAFMLGRDGDAPPRFRFDGQGRRLDEDGRPTGETFEADAEALLFLLFNAAFAGT